MQLADVETCSNFNTSNPHLQKLHNLKYLPALKFTKIDCCDGLMPQNCGEPTKELQKLQQETGL